jgi:N-acetylneuraminic acid mutarotase
MPGLPGMPRNISVAFSIGNKGYLGTGQGAAIFTTDFWEYDVATGAWTQKANFAGAPRSGAVGNSANGKGYLGLGQGSTGFLTDWWEYDPTFNTWTVKAPFVSAGRRMANCFVIGKEVYVACGSDGRYKKDMWAYNVTTDTWSPKTDFGGTARHSAVCYSIGSKAYIGTGYDSTLHFKKDMWEYNSILNNWKQITDYGGTAREGAIAFTLGKLSFIGLGYDTSCRQDMWRYLPAPSTGLEMDNKNSITLFPNPCKDYLNIKGCKITDGICKLTLNNLVGQEVFSTFIDETNSKINLENLPKGIYIATLKDNNELTISLRAIYKE